MGAGFWQKAREITESSAYGDSTKSPHALTVNLAPISDVDDEDAHGSIVEMRDDAVIANAIFPEGAQR